jgi:hypothetical protein
MVLAIVGLAIEIFGAGWLILLVALGFCVVGVLMGNIPTVYLAYLVKFYADFNEVTLNPKQAYKIVEEHLRSPDDVDTVGFLADTAYKFDQMKNRGEKTLSGEGMDE